MSFSCSHDFDIVGQQIKLHPAPKDLARLPKFPRLDRNRISNVPKSISPKSPRLGQSRNRNRPIIPRSLNPRDLDTFMRLYMRAEADVISSGNVCDPHCISATRKINEGDFKSDGIFHVIIVDMSRSRSIKIQFAGIDGYFR